MEVTQTFPSIADDTRKSLSCSTQADDEFDLDIQFIALGQACSAVSEQGIFYDRASKPTDSDTCKFTCGATCGYRC